MSRREYIELVLSISEGKMTSSSSYYRANPQKLSCSWHEGGTKGIPGKRRNSREDSKVRYAETHSEQRNSVLRALGE